MEGARGQSQDLVMRGAELPGRPAMPKAGDWLGQNSKGLMPLKTLCSQILLDPLNLEKAPPPWRGPGFLPWHRGDVENSSYRRHRPRVCPRAPPGHLTRTRVK